MVPEFRVFTWLTGGATAGITMMLAVAGRFSVLEENEPESFEEVTTDIHTFENYPGIDDDQAAIDEIDGHIIAGHLYATTSLSEARMKLGGAELALPRLVSSPRSRRGS